MPRCSSPSRIIVSAVLLTLFIFGGCSKKPEAPAAPADTRDADEAAIRSASAAWSAAAQAHDAQKAVSYFADDAVQLPDRGPAVKGRDNFLKGWTEMLAMPGPGLSFQTTAVEVARSGDLAYEYGTYTFASADKKGKISEEKGKYVFVWKKQPSGEWKVVLDMDNLGT